MWSPSKLPFLSLCAGQKSCVVPQLCALHFESAEHLEIMLTAKTGRSRFV